MPRQFRDVWICLRKRRFAGRAEAEGHLAHLKRRASVADRGILAAYRCGFCDGWHVGRAARKRMTRPRAPPADRASRASRWPEPSRERPFPMTTFRFIPTVTLVALALFAAAADGQQSCPGGQCARPRYYTAQHVQGQPARYATPAAEPRLYYAAQAPRVASYYAAAPTAIQTTTGDVLAPVNAERARHGLRPLAFDANLAAWAASNNRAQGARGLGHHVQCGAWQCAAVGTPTAQAAVAMWMASPAHRAILLNPSLTSAGIAIGWNTATFNAR